MNKALKKRLAAMAMSPDSLRNIAHWTNLWQNFSEDEKLFAAEMLKNMQTLEKAVKDEDGH